MHQKTTVDLVVIAAAAAQAQLVDVRVQKELLRRSIAAPRSTSRAGRSRRRRRATATSSPPPSESSYAESSRAPSLGRLPAGSASSRSLAGEPGRGRGPPGSRREQTSRSPAPSRSPGRAGPQKDSPQQRSAGSSPALTLGTVAAARHAAGPAATPAQESGAVAAAAAAAAGAAEVEALRRGLARRDGVIKELKEALAAAAAGRPDVKADITRRLAAARTLRRGSPDLPD
jgi:hypothetical protein